VKKFLIAAALCVVAPAAANASSWTAYYDCGQGVVPMFGGWHGKTWIDGVEENHEIIPGVEDQEGVVLDPSPDKINIFQDLGMDVREGEEPTSLNADKTVFDFKVKWHGKPVILRWRNDHEVTFDGQATADTMTLRLEHT
jgi:hypothetical protein